jgi:hypothetical protein
MSYNNVGKVWTPESFGQYLKTIKPPTWAKGVCLHHTAAPSLSQRPKGWTIQHIINMREFYKGMKWRSGPHLYTDEDQVFGMTPLTETGVHAVSFNRTTIGIEALGYYSKGQEDPKSGRGLQVWLNTAQTTKQLLNWLGLPVNEKTVLFHRDDPRTSKDCPGSQVDKNWILSLINQRPIENKECQCGEEKIEETFVKVYDVIKSKGYSDTDIKKNLRREGKNFFWLDDHLEFAYYDSKQAATMAPLSELNNIPSK